MPNYEYLNNLPANSFLNPNLFATLADTFPENITNGYAEKQYQKALDTAKDAEYFTISAKSTWGAVMKSGGILSSCEGIGYHACTKDLLRGMLDSGLPIYVYRYNGQNMIINEKREVVPMVK
jgi:hypothetical protein